MSLAGKKFLLITPSDENKAHQSAMPVDGDFDGKAVGFESNELSRAVNLIETTNKDSNFNREYLEQAGLKMTDISGSGKLQDNTLTDSVEKTFEATQARWFRMVQEDNATWKITAKFMIESFNKTGVHDDATSFDISLKSTGPVTVVR